MHIKLIPKAFQATTCHRQLLLIVLSSKSIIHRSSIERFSFAVKSRYIKIIIFFHAKVFKQLESFPLPASTPPVDSLKCNI